MIFQKKKKSLFRRVRPVLVAVGGVTVLGVTYRWLTKGEDI